MAASGGPKRPIDQLVDLFVYAPLGFLYERDEVLDKVVTRGKSQVQLARLMAKMASQQSGGTEAMVGDAVNFAADVVAKSITEFGVAFGLVPRSEPERQPSTVVDVDEVKADPTTGGDQASVDTDDRAGADPVGSDRDDSSALPIEDYDSLNARAVIAALDELAPDQVAQIADYERSGRNRKTILAKADRLVG